MIVLPPYIKALLSPRQSPQMTHFHLPYRQASALLDDTEQATHDGERPSSLDFLSNSSFHQSGDSALSDAFSSLDVFSNPTFFPDDERNQANSGLWETLIDNTSVSFSPRRRSFRPSPSGRDIQTTRTENSSPFTRQMNGISSYASATQSANDDFALSDLNLDLDFSMFLNSPHRSSTAPSSSQLRSHPRGSVERMSISPLRLTDRDDTHREISELNLVSKSTSAAVQALESVTEEDVTADSIASLLFSLKHLIFPRFDKGNQKYDYEDSVNSVLSNIFCPHWCEWLYFELEELLDLSLEQSQRSIRKRRAARIQGSSPFRCNFKPNERRQSFEPSDGTQRLSNSTKAIVATKLRSVFFHRYSTPTAEVVFECREEPISLMREERIDLNHLITISFMPRATERTPGLCARLSKIKGGPAIAPHIDTINVIPDDSPIIQCVRKNDLRGIQTLFALGAASARDVDSVGRSLLYVSIVNTVEQEMPLLTDCAVCHVHRMFRCLPAST